MKDILLVTMPWNAMDMPSLQLGILAAAVKQTHPNLACEVFYGNLFWAEYLLSQSSGRVTRADDYPMIAEQSFGFGAGEWIFTPALYDDPPDAAEYLRFIQETRLFTSENLEIVKWMYTQSRPFIRWLVDEVITAPYRLIGFTSTFMQNVPSLALAKALKERHPGTQIVFGGANCEGPQGEALHRNFPWVDFVVRGEGEITFPALVNQLFQSQTRDFSLISQLCWRKPNAEPVANPAQGDLADLETAPLPDYDAYFETLEQLQVGVYVQPEIPLESSRGCWWGAKNHCLFCGLNGTSMTYRSKSAEKVYNDLISAVNRYKTLDVFMVDNIMDLRYMEQLLPRLRETDWDLNLFYEVKANLRQEQVRLFSEAGVRRIQPGMESLGSRVLKIMRKGITAIQNVQLLTWCEQYNIEVFWNILYGVPGETADDYERMLSRMHFLHHLQPPDIAVRVMLERFSPYFTDPCLGLHTLGPARFYDLVYKLPKEELAHLAYIFQSDAVGISEQEAQPLKVAVAEWQEAYLTSTLTYRVGPQGTLRLYDTRPRRLAQDHVIADPMLATAYLELKTARTPEDLRLCLYNRTGDQRLRVGSDYIYRWCQDLSDQGLLFESDAKFLALAIPDDPRRTRRVMTERERRFGSSGS